jgi:hypothetical protein
MRRLHFALLSLVLVLAAQPLFATTYYVSTSGATIKDNIIQNNGYGTAIDTTGIAFNCNKGNTVSGNTINGATTGLSNVPAGFTGVNYFHNVGTVSAYLPPTFGIYLGV